MQVSLAGGRNCQCIKKELKRDEKSGEVMHNKKGKMDYIQGKMFLHESAATVIFCI